MINIDIHLCFYGVYILEEDTIKNTKNYKKVIFFNIIDTDEFPKIK
jgi:hypothetical protein